MIISMTATTIYFGPLVDGDEGLFCCKRDFWERAGIINLLSSADRVKCVTLHWHNSFNSFSRLRCIIFSFLLCCSRVLPLYMVVLSTPWKLWHDKVLILQVYLHSVAVVLEGSWEPELPPGPLCAVLAAFLPHCWPWHAPCPGLLERIHFWACFCFLQG